MSLGKRPKNLLADLSTDFLATSLELVPKIDDYLWPSKKFRDNPVSFFTDVLGVNPWDKQIEIIEAVRDHKRIAVRSGHKVSKSHSAAGIALWFYCSFDDARVVMTSTTSRQVDSILWRELRMMRARAKRPIQGEMHELARSGFKAADFREVVGFTAREAEAVAGVSGKNLLYIVDEASGVDDLIFEAIEGNRAGGARVLMFSNPTRNEGEFFEAFNSKAEFYKTIHISSEETPNVVEGREVIAGLATKEWVEEKKREWGEDSLLYQVRVKGNFPTKEDGKVLTLHDITQAELRWHDMPTDYTARLFIGLDPAGPGNAGDETAMAARRGLKITRLQTWRDLTEEAVLVHLLGFIREERRPREPPPVVVVDREGSVGAKVYGLLMAHASSHPNDFEVYGVRSSERAFREPKIYGLVRDELLANLQFWVRKLGGAIPEDAKLLKELHAPEFKASGIPERLRATPKPELKKILGRSPDRMDAVTLSVWEPASVRLDEVREEPEPDMEENQAPSLNPYDGIAIWQGRR